MTSILPAPVSSFSPGSADSEAFASDTWAVIAGRGVRAPASPLNVSPVLASNFLLGGDRAYARDDGTPRCDAFEEVLGALEHGIAVEFAPGMATAAAIFDLLPAGADVVLNLVGTLEA